MKHFIVLKYGISLVISLFIATSLFGQKGLWLDKQIKENPAFQDHHVGFILADPKTKEVLYTYQANKYFTPASNTKLFTWYTAKKFLGDSLPGLLYEIHGDTLFFWGTGNPTLFHPFVNQDSIFHFLKAWKGPLVFASHPVQSENQGPGWTWKDNQYYYGTFRSEFPIYGNNVMIGRTKKTKETFIQPSFFESAFQVDTLKAGKAKVSRSPQHNIFYWNPDEIKPGDTLYRPFIPSEQPTVLLLEDTLKRNIDLVEKTPSKEAMWINSGPSLPVFQEMMKESDNSFAEQLLMMTALKKRNTLDGEDLITWLLDSAYTDFPQKTIWVDGSGLSRYNLSSPQIINHLLHKIYHEIPSEEIFSSLAFGGGKGTLKAWYKNNPPFVYGKTGTLRNNHALSGYLICNSGRILSFSFLHNHYENSSIPIKKEMEKILRYIKSQY